MDIPATPDNEPASVVSPTTLDRSDSSSTMDLYRSAVGDIGWAHYERVFTRFDAKDRAGWSWNWAAACLTVPWMAFRQLWGAALAYVGAVVAAVVMLLGIGRLVFHWSPEVQWAMVGVCLLLSIALPGALGDALVYQATRRKMSAALEANTTVTEASVMLRKAASTRWRLAWITLAGLLFWGAILAVSLALPDADKLPLATPKMAQARNVTLGTVTDPTAPAASSPASAPASMPAPIRAASAPPAASVASLPSAVASASVASAPQATVPQQAPATAAQPTPLASATASASTSVATAKLDASAPLKATVASSPSSTPQAPAAVAPMPGRSTWTAAQMMPPLAPTPPPATAPAAGASRPVESAPPKVQALPLPPAQPPADTKKQASPATSPAAPKTVKPAQTQASEPRVRPTQSKAAAAAATDTASHPTYVVNVGLFADDNNARNAFTKLTDAGLPAYQQIVKGPRGRFTRVRVGPFDTEVEAETAADKVRLLGLDAMVARP